MCDAGEAKAPVIEGSEAARVAELRRDRRLQGKCAAVRVTELR